MKKPSPFALLKWAIILTAYCFLLYKLLSFEYYSAIKTAWQNGQLFTQWHYALLVLILLPFNWLFETMKWKFLLRNLESLTIKAAFKSVMIGNIAAFFTPNRLGEFPGRSITLPKGKKLQGTTIGILGSIAQTLTITLVGIPAAWMLFCSKKASYNNTSPFVFIGIFLGLLMLYFLLPRIANSLKSFRALRKIEHLLESLAQFSLADLTGVFLLSLFRYGIFCTQFYFLLHFFSVQLDPLFGAIAIATNYLFITFTPSLAFSEGAVRASIAVLTIGILSTNTIGIIAAGLSIWLLNFVIPMLIGSVIFAKK